MKPHTANNPGNNSNHLYIDCQNSGISGDMFLSALYGLIGKMDALNNVISAIREEFPKIEITVSEIEKIKRNSITVNHLKLAYQDRNGAVESLEKSETHDPHHHDHHHHHSVPEMITKIGNVCETLGITKLGTQYAVEVINIIAEAEGKVHETPREKVHLHEIGSIDTVIDVCAATYFLDLLGVFSAESKSDITVCCSPIPVGGGSIRIAHGVVPVPAPATDQIIKTHGLSVIGGPIQKELCTPTGAAVIAALVKLRSLKFEKFMPELTVDKVALSTGNLKDEEFPNILRLYLGAIRDVCKSEFDVGKESLLSMGAKMQSVTVLETTVDDMTGEDMGSLLKILYKVGALDVNYIAAQSKKNRPALLIRVICDSSSEELCIKTILKNTSTLGVRIRNEDRICLNRKIITNKIEIDGKQFSYRVKIAGRLESDVDFIQYKIEHDDIEYVAKNTRLSLIESRNRLKSDFFEKIGV